MLVSGDVKPGGWASKSNRLDCSSVEIIRMLLLGRKEGAYGQALSTDERQ